MSRTLLVVEDERPLAETLRFNLELEGYRVRTAEDGIEGLSMARALQPDLVLLDLMLPRLDGLDVLRGIRETSQAPVLLLTARTSEADRVKGLDLGADDYITKPFSLAELKARVRVHLRRKQEVTVEDRVLEFGDAEHRFTLDLNRRLLTRTASRSRCVPRSTNCSPTSPSATAAPSPATSCSTTCGTSPSPAGRGPSMSTYAGCARRLNSRMFRRVT